MRILRHIILTLMTAATLPVVADTTAYTDTIALNELTVTAVKQSPRLVALPTSSTLVTAAEADRLNIVTLKGISDVVPNFFIPDYGSRMTSSIYVRGIGARMDQPAVGLSVDNVTFLNKDAYDFDIPDMVSVEMLRGPQSTLYGRNTMGGQINITTLSPLQWQGVRLTATVGNGPDIRANAGWYHAFNANTGLSLSAGYSWSDGWFRNAYNNSKTDRENLWNVRSKFEWRPASTLALTNTIALSGLRQGGYPYEYVETGRIEYNDTCFYRRFCLNDGLTVRWTPGKVALTSITSFQYIDDNMTLDQDFLPMSYFTLTQKKREPAVTQDIVARGNAAGWYSWTAGAFGFYKHLDMEAPVTFLDDGIRLLIEDHRNAANTHYPISWDTRTFPLDSRFKMPTLGGALYHESRFTLGRWQLTAGIRLDSEKVTMSYRSICHTGYTVYHNEERYNHVDIDIDDTGHLSHTFTQVLPKFAVMYSFNDASTRNIYINVAKGYKAGGFNTQMFSDILQQRLMGVMGIASSYDVDRVVSYRPEKSWNFEVGTHLSTADGRLRGQFTLFYINCTDQQLTMFPDGTTTGRIMTNAGRTRSYGLEAQLSLTDIGPFAFNASYGFTDARFTHFDDGTADYSGRYLPYAPRNTIFGQALCFINPRATWLDRISIDLNVRAGGKIYWNEANTLSQPLYARLGASLTFEKDDFTLQLWGENLTDTRYDTFYFESIGNSFVQRGKPLQLGATLRLTI